tara:strand:- start:322 stop:741 length:420 start_codon:yes stop_codon:yes gene_type:complete
MKTNKIFWILLVFLVLTNIITIGLMLRGGHKGPPPPISEKLELTGDNKIKADKIFNEHHQQKRKLMNKSRELRKSFYLQVFEKNNKADSLLKLLTLNDQKINKMTFDFFMQISNLCNDSQKEELKRNLKNFPPKHKRKK